MENKTNAENKTVCDDKPCDVTTPRARYTVLGTVAKYAYMLFETDQETLFRAIYEGDMNKVVDLFEKKVDFHGSDDEGNSVLHAAVFGRQIGMLNMLLGMGISPNRVNHNGENILMVAIKLGFNDICEEIMKIKDFNYGLTDLQGQSLLHYCAIYGRAIMAEEILKHDVNVDSVDFNYNSSLHVCCLHNSHNVAKVLLDHNCRTTQKNLRLLIPIEIAVKMEDREMVKLIFTKMRGENFENLDEAVDEMMKGKEDPLMVLNKSPSQFTPHTRQEPVRTE
ncbi:ankyrin repeat-containing protein, putative [Entamoeba invadens IP1]|uniref:Ankyrin repeat-containing protein, putative n=1 Tax=Entamoeba invadens IP1 TaxID=370355 RepID=A0A0A1U8Q2_ENTIV|nr:ankyrin repeat-containing protein, putative [Entamoeba invadens IP1]ELP88363.1 ankyrin repeat-containing protein, putative [Entamoeba invadens IP1]|eukprot:XP_004255134.1 ankyrin repeat-containing protein, putative [Entamoeba invadens IP1]